MAVDPRAPAPAGAGDSTVTQDYLKAVWSASEWGGPGASITGLSRRMGVAPSTASENVSRLVEAGLLLHEPYKAVTLTEHGRGLATSIVRRHRLLETYLVERLGLGWDEVHDEAEVLEHAVSDRLLEALDDALGHPVRDPHGDPVPAPDGSCVQPALRSVDALRVGQTGVVGRILDDVDTLRELAAAGIGLDTPVTVVDRVPAPARPEGESTRRGGRSARRRASVLRAVLPAGARRPETETAIVGSATVWVLDERAR